MSLEKTISDHLKAAMKAGDTLRRDTLRMLIAAMKNERIERGSDLDEAAVMAVVRRGVKSRKDSAEQYRAADRLDLAEKEESEIAVLEGYLPQMLDEAATAAIVEQAIADGHTLDQVKAAGLPEKWKGWAVPTLSTTRWLEILYQGLQRKS